MRGLMMEYQLTLPTILRRAETLFGKKEIITRLSDRSLHRYTYKDLATRAKKLAVALQVLGVRAGDRVATLSWNHYQHLEAYFAVPCMGAIIHPLNLRFSPEDLGYIVSHAEDKVIIVDEVLLPLFEKFSSGVNVSRVIVIRQTAASLAEGYLDYEDLVAGGDAVLPVQLQRAGYRRAGYSPARCTHVPCECLGPAVWRYVCRSDAGVPGPLPGP